MRSVKARYSSALKRELLFEMFSPEARLNRKEKTKTKSEMGNEMGNAMGNEKVKNDVENEWSLNGSTGKPLKSILRNGRRIEKVINEERREVRILQLSDDCQFVNDGHRDSDYSDYSDQSDEDLKVYQNDFGREPDPSTTGTFI